MPCALALGIWIWGWERGMGVFSTFLREGGGERVIEEILMRKDRYDYDRDWNWKIIENAAPMLILTMTVYMYV